tara:strand:+ start:5355 stop:5666 length:312 start_codon:yes stop_codon:yes gene_type:complete
MDDEPHFITRLRERFGVVLPIDRIGEFSATAEADGLLIGTARDGTIYRLTKWEGHLMAVAIAPNGTIKTIMHPGAFRVPRIPPPQEKTINPKRNPIYIKGKRA